MKHSGLVLFGVVVLSVASGLAADAPGSAPVGHVLATAANGSPITSPTSSKTYSVKEGEKLVEVPEGIVYVPAGRFIAGEGAGAKEVSNEAFCMGRFEVTNAEWKQFLNATQGRAPRYWKDDNYPAGKANHPVLYVSLTQAKAYCEWVSRSTGWQVVVPTADQWERAARSPKGGRYPWGDENGAIYEGGLLKTRFNYNGVCTAHFLAKPDTVTVYGERSKRKGEPVAVKDISDGQRALSISRDGGVGDWIDHTNNTGFVGTKLYCEASQKPLARYASRSEEPGAAWSNNRVACRAPGGLESR